MSACAFLLKQYFLGAGIRMERISRYLASRASGKQMIKYKSALVK